MNRHHFSALDRHAVLSGSDDGFPWYAGTMLAVEASEVMRLRLEKFAHGDEVGVLGIFGAEEGPAIFHEVAFERA